MTQNEENYDEIKCSNCDNWIGVDISSKGVQLSICQLCLHPNYYSMDADIPIPQGVIEFFKKINDDCEQSKKKYTI